MRLRHCDLAAYAVHVAAQEGGAPDDVLERIERDLAAGALFPSDIFVSLDPAGRVVGDIRLFAVAERIGVLTEWRGEASSRSGSALDGLISEALARASERGIDEVVTRVDAGSLTADYQRALCAAGFERVGVRVEYRAPIARIPAAGPSRLAWRTMAEAGRATVLDLLREASTGTPDGVDLGGGQRRIDDLLGAEYEALDPRTVQVGSLDGRPIAVLLVRVDPGSGWATLPFMGIVPAARGRGLGRDVHRRGIETIRALGGTLYHDGTSGSNLAMIRLFETLGGAEHSRMEEWRWGRGVEPPVREGDRRAARGAEDLR